MTQHGSYDATSLSPEASDLIAFSQFTEDGKAVQLRKVPAFSTMKRCSLLTTSSSLGSTI